MAQFEEVFGLARKTTLYRDVFSAHTQGLCDKIMSLILNVFTHNAEQQRTASLS